MSKFLHHHAKAIAIPWIFSENSQAKNFQMVCHKKIVCLGFYAVSTVFPLMAAVQNSMFP